MGPCPASPAHHTLGSAPPRDQAAEATGLGTPGVGSSLGLGPAMLVPRLLGPLRTHTDGDAQTCRLGRATGGATDRSDSRKVAQEPMASSCPRGRPRCSQGRCMAHEQIKGPIRPAHASRGSGPQGVPTGQKQPHPDLQSLS